MVEKKGGGRVEKTVRAEGEKWGEKNLKGVERFRKRDEEMEFK